MQKYFWLLFLFGSMQCCPAQVPNNSIMKFASKPLQGKQVTITMRGGSKENERMIQVTIGTGKEAFEIHTEDVKVSAMDQAGRPIEVTKFGNVTAIHPHQTGMSGERWAGYNLVLKDGQKVSSVTVKWNGEGQKFGIAEGVLSKEEPRR